MARAFTVLQLPAVASQSASPHEPPPAASNRLQKLFEVYRLFGLKHRKMSPRSGDQCPSREPARFTPPGRVVGHARRTPPASAVVTPTASVVRRLGHYPLVTGEPGWHPRRANRVLFLPKGGERASAPGPHDANFNVTAALGDSTQTVVGWYGHTPYGEVTFLDPDFSLASSRYSSAIGNTHLYTGRGRDPETGLQLNRHRYYASWLGRWTTRDPIGTKVASISTILLAIKLRSIVIHMV